MRHDGLIEITYTRQDTAIDLDSRPLFDATLDYLHAGGAVGDPHSARRDPSSASRLGASRLDPDPGGIDSEWLFSAGMYGGVKHWIGERVGLRVEGRGLLHSPAAARLLLQLGRGRRGCAVNLEGSGFLQIQGLVGPDDPTCTRRR